MLDNDSQLALTDPQCVQRHENGQDAKVGAGATDNSPHRRAFGASVDPQRAQEGKRRAIEAGAHLRRDFLDAPLWDDLAQARGVRLPQWHKPATSGQVAKWLRRLGLDAAAYLDNLGHARLGDFATNNPDWPLRAVVGLMLEEAA